MLSGESPGGRREADVEGRAGGVGTARTSRPRTLRSASWPLVSAVSNCARNRLNTSSGRRRFVRGGGGRAAGAARWCGGRGAVAGAAPQPVPPAAARGGGRGGGGRGATPEQIEAARQQAASIRAWRLSAPTSRQKLRQSGAGLIEVLKVVVSRAAEEPSRARSGRPPVGATRRHHRRRQTSPVLAYHHQGAARCSRRRAQRGEHRYRSLDGRAERVAAGVHRARRGGGGANTWQGDDETGAPRVDHPGDDRIRVSGARGVDARGRDQ